MDPIDVGVIGTGHLGTFHARAYQRVPQARLVGLYDADEEKARKLAGELGVEATGDLDRLLSMTRAVSVAVPTSAHHRIASRCLQGGVHVLVEKPISTTLEEADDLIGQAQKAGLVLQVGHIERFNPAFLALDRMGLKPVFIESHRLARFNPRGTDVAVILDLMIHDIDLVLALVDLPVRSVEAAGVAVLSRGEDIANARVTFSNGTTANLTASRISAKAMRKLRLFGPDTYASADFLNHQVEVFRLRHDERPADAEQNPLGDVVQEILLSKGQTIVCQHPALEKKDALQMQLKSFLESVQGDRPAAVSGEDGRRALRLALDIIDHLTEHARWVRTSTPI
jgi:predicted dehydrogenase